MKNFCKIVVGIICSIAGIAFAAEKSPEITRSPVTYNIELVSSPEVVTIGNSAIIMYSVTNSTSQAIPSTRLDGRKLPSGATFAPELVPPPLETCAVDGVNFTLDKLQTCYTAILLEPTEPAELTGYLVVCSAGASDCSGGPPEEDFHIEVIDSTFIPISISGPNTLLPGETVTWTITNHCTSTYPYNDCAPENLTAYAIGLTFEDGTLAGQITLDTNNCQVVPAGTSCFYVVTASSTADSISGTVMARGSNTGTAFMSVSIEQEAPLIGSTISITEPNTVACAIYTNKGTGNLYDITLDSLTGVENVELITTSPLPESACPLGQNFNCTAFTGSNSLAEDDQCCACAVGTEDASGVEGIFEFHFKTGSETGPSITEQGDVSVAQVEFFICDGNVACAGNTPITISGTDTSGPFTITNNGAFVAQNPVLALTNSTLNTTTILPTSGCASPWAGGASCTLEWQTGTNPPTGSATYVAVASNSAGYATTPVLTSGSPTVYLDPHNQHLQYTRMIIDNTENGNDISYTAVLNGTNINNYVYACGDETDTAHCDYYSTAASGNYAGLCGVGTATSLGAGQYCDRWLKSLTPSNQPLGINDGQFTVTLQNVAEPFVFNLYQQMAAYITGFFNTAGASTHVRNIAKWDGTSWGVLDTWPGQNNILFDNGLLGPGFALEVYRGDLYAGGGFLVAGGRLDTLFFAGWNGVKWFSPHPDPVTLLDGFVESLSVTASPDVYQVNGDHPLYVGGDFDNVGTTDVRNLAQFSTSGVINPTPAFGPIDEADSGVSEPAGFSAVYALLTSGNTVFVGGDFTDTHPATSSGNPNNIALWTSSAWNALSGGTTANGIVFGIAANTANNQQYVVGAFNRVYNGNTSVSAHNVASWNGSTWSHMDGGFLGGARAVTLFNGSVYAGGYFVCGGHGIFTHGLNHVARWTGAGWTNVGSGLGNPGTLCVNFSLDSVQTLTGHNGVLYAGGHFPAQNNLAYWNGSTWHALGGGVNFSLIPAFTYVQDVLVTSSLLVVPQ